MLHAFFQNYLRPLLGRPSRFQVAALCHRDTPDGLRVLLLTSLDTGRWVLPKGWPKQGFDARGAALEEAWEEAGVKPDGAEPVEIGHYVYDKRLTGGVPVRTDVKVFAIRVVELSDSYPEALQRERRWMSLEEAAEAVDEPSLKDLLRSVPADIAG